MIALSPIDANDQLLSLDLDGTSYHFGLGWNEAGQLWTISIRDLNRQILVSGIRVVPLYPMLHQVRRPELPPGELCVDCSPGVTLTRTSFIDGTAAIWYFDVDDMAEIEAYEPPPVVFAATVPVGMPRWLRAVVPGASAPSSLLMDDNSVLTDDGLVPIEV